ncbi:MAG: toprim domain-containing protein [Clostridia bacterium]|nr:toprim domain-containing protein [Clostridia bacterium]
MNITELKQHIFQNSLQRKILEELGLHNIREDSNKIQCSNIDGDNPTAICIYKNNVDLMVTNYTRDIKDKYNNSDIIALVEFVKNYDFAEAVQWIQKVLDIDNKPAKKEITEQDKLDYIFNNSNYILDDKQDEVLLPAISEDYLNAYLSWNNTEFYKDNISYETQAEFELGIDVFSHRITIPIRDELGRLVGIKGRRVWDVIDEYNPKYLYLYNCEKSKILYGLYKTLPFIKERNEVIICESEKGVMQLWSYGFKNSVSIGGHSLSDWQVRRIEDLDVDIVIAFDEDVENDIIFEEAKKFLTENKIYYINDIENILNIKESPMDSPGNWDRLYKNRFLFMQNHCNDWEV